MSMYSNGGLTHVEAPPGASFDASTETVSASYFDLVGARLSAGRFFTDSDEGVVIITEGFRRRMFGNGSGVGETVKLDTMPATVIGVIADGFTGLQPDTAPDIIVSFPVRRTIIGDASRPLRAGVVVGRLARGVSIGAARAELLARWPSIQSATVPAALTEGDRAALLRQRVDVASLATGFLGLRDRYATTLWLLLALVGILLAVACANLAGLTLARSLTRRHQVAIRLALGGSAWRVFWQLLIDGLLLSAGAFVGALPLAWWMLRTITASLVIGPVPSKFPSLTADGRVFAATALLTLVIGLAIGAVSAWKAVVVRVDEGLRHGRRIAGSFGRFGRALLVAQIALSMTLLPDSSRRR